jgi:hypothetical protein
MAGRWAVHVEHYVWIDNTRFLGASSETVTDRSLSNTYLGKPHWRDNEYFNGDVAGVFVVDEYLSTDTASTVVEAMMRDDDLSDDSTCKMCVVGKYKTAQGSVTCIDCESGKNVSIGATTDVSVMEENSPPIETIRFPITGKFKTVCCNRETHFPVQGNTFHCNREIVSWKRIVS